MVIISVVWLKLLVSVVLQEIKGDGGIVMVAKLRVRHLRQHHGLAVRPRVALRCVRSPSSALARPVGKRQHGHRRVTVGCTCFLHMVNPLRLRSLGCPSDHWALFSCCAQLFLSRPTRPRVQLTWGVVAAAFFSSHVFTGRCVLSSPLRGTAFSIHCTSLVRRPSRIVPCDFSSTPLHISVRFACLRVPLRWVSSIVDSARIHAAGGWRASVRRTPNCVASPMLSAMCPYSSPILRKV